MNNQCDVILTYCWNRVGYTILKSLYKKGLKVWVADTSKINICSVSKFCSGSFTYPDPFKEEEAFISILKEKIYELRPKVLIPTHDESIIIMRHRNLFPANLIIPYDNYEKLLRLSNKAISTEIARKAGVPVPRVYYSVDEIKDYPVVLKTVIGNSAKGVFFPSNKEELLKLIKEHGSEEILLQEWIGGTDYSVDCVRWDGFCKMSVYHALVTKTEGGGTTTQREIVNVPMLESEALKLIESVDFHGVCGLDFRYDPKKNRVAYIETNARFTGGIATPVNAGFDIPWILYKLSTEGKYEDDINIRVGTRTKWILGDIITIIGRILKFKWNISELRRVFTFRGFDAFDDYNSDDKLAIIGECIYYWEKLIKHGKLNP